MGQVKDRMIERDEIEQAARGRCCKCGERLQQGEENECFWHSIEEGRD